MSDENEEEHNLKGEEVLPEEDNKANSPKNNVLIWEAEVRVEYTTDKNLNYFVNDKKLRGQKKTIDYLENMKNNLKYKIQFEDNDNLFCFEENAI